MMLKLNSPFEAVDLWLVDLDAIPVNERDPYLSAVEIDRAARFAFERDARRYRAAHAALRRLLESHCELTRGAEFETGVHGKPSIAASRWFFNMSHSERWAMIGLSEKCEIGVDIEVVRQLDTFNLADHNFTVGERAELRASASNDVLNAFFRCWTRKEACLKAVGAGLHVEPASFDVGLAAQHRVARVRSELGVFEVEVRSVQLAPFADLDTTAVPAERCEPWLIAAVAVVVVAEQSQIN